MHVSQRIPRRSTWTHTSHIPSALPLSVSVRTFDGYGAPAAHGIDDDVARRDVGQLQHVGADGGAQRRRAEVRDVALEQALGVHGEAEVHLREGRGKIIN